MKKILYILILFSSIPTFAQNFADKDYYLIDSLDLKSFSSEDKKLLTKYLKEYHQANNDTVKINALAHICENMVNESWKKYQFFNVVLLETKVNSKHQDAYKKFYLSHYAEALNNLGIIHQESGELEKGLKSHKKSLEIQRDLENQEGIANSLSNIGVIYYNKGNIPQALESYQKGLTLRELLLEKDTSNKDIKSGVASILNNIGVLYQNQDDNKNALTYYNKSLILHREVNDKTGLANTINNIGIIYFNEKNFPLALQHYKEAVEINITTKDINSLALNYDNIGVLYNKKGDNISALQYLNKSIDLSTQINDSYGLTRTLCNAGFLYMEMGNYKIAKQYIKRAYELAIELKSPMYVRNSSKGLVILLEQEEKYEQALEMFKLHITMKDSINNDAAHKATAQQQAKYEYEKQKAIDDAKHDKEIAIEQEAKEKQTILTYATAVGLGLVGIFLLVVFNRLKVTRKQKNIIEKQKTEVENQKAVVDLAHTELEEKNKEITDSIQYAKRIQNAILPPNKVVKEYLKESFIYYKPKDIVAGDFYWLEQKENKVLFAAADCTGHGVPGAMVSVVCNNGLNRSVREYGLTDPGEILDKARQIVVEEFEKSEEEVKDGMDIALCSLEGNKLQYAGAHNPLWIIREGELLETKANKQPIGQFENPEPYTTHTIELQKGDSIYIFSDGYADQFGGDKGKKLKTSNFKNLLLSIQKETMEKQKQLIDEAFEKWKGDLEQLDDVCVIGVRI